MTRAKSGDSGRGKPINLPAWWLAALNRRCGDRSRPKITEELNAVTRRQPPFRVEAVYDFLSGKVTTDIMMDAFLLLFPELPPPIFYASSEDEARRFQQLARLYARPLEFDTEPKVSETIEDTGVTAARKGSGEKKTRETTQERTGSRRRAQK